MVGKITSSVAAESVSVSDITDKIPQIPDAVVISSPVAAEAVGSVPAAIVSVPDVISVPAAAVPDVSAVSSGVR